MNVLVLGGGGFIGGHMAKHHKDLGNWVRVVDIKRHEYFNEGDICDDFILGDLRDLDVVNRSMWSPDQKTLNDGGFDLVYQFAADMGGAGYVFTGTHDADIVHNSAMINLNVAKAAVEYGVKKLFFSSSACTYPQENQTDFDTVTLKESSVYPANPDSDYGWEKLFSERLYLAFRRNYGLDVSIARFHNIFGTHGTWKGGKEKVPAALCRKVIEADNEIEVWGDGEQARSFLIVDECVEAIERLMDSDFYGPVNIGSTEMVTINELAKMIINLSGKDIKIKHIDGPIGVRARKSDNELIREKLGWEPSSMLVDGVVDVYNWVKEQVEKDAGHNG